MVSTSSEPLVGDEVWMLYGARAMFILRKLKGIRYNLISAASVYYEVDGKLELSPIMFGALLQEVESGGANFQDIVIE